jgi:DNA-binding NarL/FixJ family response regulator
MISVAVADDQELIRSAIRELIAQEPDMTLIAESIDGAQAISVAVSERPDVILMDIRMPGVDGIEATRRICSDPALASVRVLILTTFEEDDYIVQALRAGASGFIGKGTDAHDLMKAIRVVHQGETLLSPTATRSLIDRYVLGRSPTSQHPESMSALTGREREVLALVGRGLSNQEIAQELTISPTTTKTHVNRIMTKLSAHDRAQLVIHAYESGLVSPTGR